MLVRTMFTIMAVAIVGLNAGPAATQDYPSRPIRLIVPFAAGGGTDIVARTIGQKLHGSMGQPVVVENRPGAAGTIGADVVAKAQADGYTIGMIATGHTISPAINAQMPYDITKDFAPITPVVSLTNLVVVGGNSPIKSMRELVEMGRSKPGTLTFGSGGIGTGQHLLQELMWSKFGVQAVHVPYKGGAPAITDIIGGRLNSMLATIVETQAHIASGNLRAVAAADSKRSPAYPDVPAVTELGITDFEGSTWFAIVAPARTPPDTIKRLHAELRKALESPDVAERISSMGAQPFILEPDAFQRFLAEQTKLWAAVVKQAGVTLQ
jgi:tripartite-type tricarboxylate transporter receptor subunit TctC